MIVDSSAIVAILHDEPDAAVFARAIEEATDLRISAANYLEVCIVIDGARSPISSWRMEDFFRDADMTIEAVTAEQARIARNAYRDFGRGSGSPAQLNFGDCFAYALAKVTREPLLFKGDDFSHTDLASAV